MRPLAPPDDLTVPAPGSTTGRDVFSRAVGRCMRDLGPALRAHAASAPEDVRTVERMLVRLPPGALASVLRRPHAATLVRVLRATPPGQGEALLTELLGTLAIDLEHLGALDAPLPLRRWPARVVSLAAGAVFRMPGRAVEHPFHGLEGAIQLALVDGNPLAMLEAHPDKHGNAVDLGGRPVAEWVVALRAALAVVAGHLPELRVDLDLYAQTVVPVGYDEQRHLSASYREAIGAIYLSLHPRPMTMVEALVHESQHGKLNALLELDPLLEGGDEATFASPVRPDPRPLRGVLLAVHAFVPVARLYERMLERGDPGASRERLGEVVALNRAGTSVLREHARPTRIGQAVLGELERWDRHFAGA